MNKSYELKDFTLDSFLHGTIEHFFYDNHKNIFQVVFSYLNLKSGGCLYECTITITDWWNLEVFEYNKQHKIKQFYLNEIPKIDRVIDFSYNDDILTLTDFGMHNDTAIDYKFTKPKIKITGEYDPD